MDGSEGVPLNTLAAAKWLTKSAEQGNAEAQCDLGTLLFAGHDSLAPDTRAALRWWTKSAEQGTVEAQFNLGVVLYIGEGGVPQDVDSATKWFIEVANNKDTSFRPYLSQFMEQYPELNLPCDIE